MIEEVCQFEQSFLNLAATLVCLCLIFDQAEKLRDSDPLLLPLVVRLGSLVHEQMRRNGLSEALPRLLTVLLTRSPWEKFPSGTFYLEPFVLSMESYSRDQTKRILQSLAPAEASQDRFGRFVDLLLTVCFPVCRNAGELVHLMQVGRLIDSLC